MVNKNWLGGALFPLVVLLYSLILLIDTRNLGKAAALVPKIILSALIILTIIQLVVYLREQKKAVPAGDSAEGGEPQVRLSALLIAIGLIVALPALAYLVGFYLAVLIYSLVFTRWIGRMSWPVTVGTAVIMVLFHHLFFVYWLGVSFPEGLLLESFS